MVASLLSIRQPAEAELRRSAEANIHFRTIFADSYVAIPIFKGQNVHVRPTRGNGWWINKSGFLCGPEGGGFETFTPQDRAEWSTWAAQPKLNPGMLIVGYHPSLKNTLSQDYDNSGSFLEVFRNHGQGRVFVTEDTIFNPDFAGYLYFCINDALYWANKGDKNGYNDNNGSIDVTIGLV